MECAGAGRAYLAPRPISAPWHDEAVGCAEWTGVSLRAILEEAGLLDDEAADIAAVVASLSKNDASRPHETSIVEQTEELLVVKAVERKTGLAQTHRLARALFESTDYRQFVKVNSQLVELAGAPPFSVALGDKAEEAYSFEELRRGVLEVARRGVNVSRFKGLGEMNPDQLRETTMDPTNRTLARVTVDDAAAADRIFSMLMGDQVEPRRDFIESNARLVSNLDV
jgi:DNA gyrase subunit B